MWKKDASEPNDHRSLLGDLESIKDLLNEEAQALDDNAPAPDKIPILLDAIVENIPVLKEAISEQRYSNLSINNASINSAPLNMNEHFQADAPAPAKSSPFANVAERAPSSKEEMLLSRDESDQLIDHLIDEYLPILESRLREQLKLRLEWLNKAKNR